MVERLCVGRLIDRWGMPRTLLGAGLFRGPWLLLVAVAPVGPVGIVMVAVAWTGLLLGAGVYNAAQTVLRQSLSPRHLRARIAAAQKCVIGAGKPIAPLLGGLTADLLGLRFAVAIGAAALCLAPLLLDRGAGRSDDAHDETAPRATAPASPG